MIFGITPYWAGILTEAGIAAIVAWGLSLAMRAGIFSVGHGALFGVGAYTAGLLAVQGVPLVLAALGGAVMAGVFGLVLALFTLRLSSLFLGLATLVFGEILRIIASGWDLVGASVGLVGIPMVNVFGITFALLIAIVLFELFIYRGSRVELLGELMEKDETLVRLAGPSPRLLRMGIFAFSAAIAGLAGSLAAYHRGIVQFYDLGFDTSMAFLAFVIFGGARSGYGPIIAAIGLTILPEALEIDGHARGLFYGGILAVFLLIRPSGIFPRRPISGPRRRKASTVGAVPN